MISDFEDRVHYGNSELQAQTTVAGLVKNSSDTTSVGFANVVLLSPIDSTYIVGAICDNDGRFRLDNISQDDVIINVSAMGYDDYYKRISLAGYANSEKTIFLNPRVLEVDDVVVVGNRPRIYSENGKLITVIENSGLEKIGNANDVLANIPGVVSNNNKIEVFGKGTPTIFIDGKQVRNDNELRLLHSENIVNVELITTPGSEYDAQTRAVMNITTNRDKNSGLSVMVDGEYRYNKYSSHYEGATLNYNHRGLSLYGSYYYYKTKGAIDYEINQAVIDDKEYVEDSGSKYEYNDGDNSYSAGISYDINEDYSLGMQFSGYNVASVTTSQFDTEKLLLDDVSNKTELLTDNIYEVFAAKADMKYTLSDVSSLKWGIGYSNVSVNGDLTTNNDYISDNDFTNNEANYNGYLSYQLKGKKISGEIGLRYEYVTSNIVEQSETVVDRDYSNLFPTLRASRPLKKGQISASLTSGIRRPSFSQLNSNVKYNNKYNQEKGNPLLTSQNVYDSELAYSFKKLNLRTNYQYIKNYSHATAELSPSGGGATTWYWINSPKYSQLGAVATYAPSVKWWSPTLTAGLYKPFFTLAYSGCEIDYSSPYGMFSLRNEFELPLDYLLMANLNYNTKGNRGGIYFNDPSGSFDIIAQKSLLSDNLSLQLRCTDIFNWSKSGDMKSVDFMNSYRFVDSYRRSVSFSLSWYFNSDKEKYYQGGNAAQSEVGRFR